MVISTCRPSTRTPSIRLHRHPPRKQHELATHCGPRTPPRRCRRAAGACACRCRAHRACPCCRVHAQSSALCPGAFEAAPAGTETDMYAQPDVYAHAYSYPLAKQLSPIAEQDYVSPAAESPVRTASLRFAGARRRRSRARGRRCCETTRRSLGAPAGRGSR